MSKKKQQQPVSAPEPPRRRPGVRWRALVTLLLLLGIGSTSGYFYLRGRAVTMGTQLLIGPKFSGRVRAGSGAMVTVSVINRNFRRVSVERGGGIESFLLRRGSKFAGGDSLPGGFIAVNL